MIVIGDNGRLIFLSKIDKLENIAKLCPIKSFPKNFKACLKCSDNRKSPEELALNLFTVHANQEGTDLQEKIKYLIKKSICNSDVLLEYLLEEYIVTNQPKKNIILDLFKIYKQSSKNPFIEQIKLLPKIQLTPIEPFLSYISNHPKKTLADQLYFEKSMGNWIFNVSKSEYHMSELNWEETFELFQKYGANLEVSINRDLLPIKLLKDSTRPEIALYLINYFPKEKKLFYFEIVQNVIENYKNSKLNFNMVYPMNKSRFIKIYEDILEPHKIEIELNQLSNKVGSKKVAAVNIF